MPQNKGKITIRRSQVSTPSLLFGALRKIGLALSFAIFLALGSGVAPALAYSQ